MSRFREELKVIPRVAWIIAILLYCASLASSWFVFFPLGSHHFSLTPKISKTPCYKTPAQARAMVAP